ncbi:MULTISPECIES: hypothetical protein [Pseudomonas]|uniref:hypothetical protein n=2 Tax=Pseudomonas TaxID=286 RepID=UPI000713488B|nr:MULTISPECIES: hypothetical protein [Pseudomonas]KRP85359.1 hypothetical protein TX25_28210 [Pseudomonas lactis]
MSEMDDDESTLKTLVKLTAESKLLYQDLQTTPKMRRARRLIYLAQMGLMAEKSMEAGHSPIGQGSSVQAGPSVTTPEKVAANTGITSLDKGMISNEGVPNLVANPPEKLVEAQTQESDLQPASSKTAAGPDAPALPAERVVSVDAEPSQPSVPETLGAVRKRRAPGWSADLTKTT